MSSTKLIISVVAVTALGAIALTSFYFLNKPSGSETPNTVKESQSLPAPNPNQIGGRWQWDNFEATRSHNNNKEIKEDESNSNQPPIEDRVVFDVVAIYDALQEVKIDDNGDVVPDPTALKSLQTLFEFSDIDWNESLLAEIQDLVKTGLPGKAGDQTAQVIGDYYRFHIAQQQFNELYAENSSYKNTPAQYAELIALREMYLGQDVSQQLFSEYDAEAQYMLAAMALEGNETLTPEEKQLAQQALAKQHHNAPPAVSNWEARYALYQQEKQQISQANISDEEKETQLARLTSQHFSNEELALIPENLL